MANTYRVNDGHRDHRFHGASDAFDYAIDLAVECGISVPVYDDTNGRLAATVLPSNERNRAGWFGPVKIIEAEGTDFNDKWVAEHPDVTGS